MDQGERDVPVRFTTPLDNDFQWYNLYMRQFGSSAYPPPMPKNPSTTNAQYPTQRDVAVLMANDRVQKAAAISGKKPDGNGDATHMNDSEDDEADQAGGRSRERLSTLGTLTDLLAADDLFSPNFFDFLHGPDGTQNELFEVLLSPRSQRALNDQPSVYGTSRRQSMFSDSGLFSAGASSVGGTADGDMMMMGGSVHPGNPHGLPREVYNIQSEAWTLLLDNRALAWLQREAAEKGKSASMVRLQLLQVATGSSFANNGHFVRDLVQGGGRLTSQQSALLTTEQSFQRVYESFSPFFAILSPPAQVKKLKDNYSKAVRAQKSGRRGPVADLVGLPIFSQYATWREAYEHRKVWPSAPFSFFLIHDQSYNYANISAIFVLINVIKAHMHRHSAQCTETATATVDVQTAGNMLSQARTARHQVAIQRQLCPYRVMEQMTENLIIAFENSDAKNALTMVSNVCRFLTDCALDQETAARFLDRSALLRQAEFKVPGLNVVDSNVTRGDGDLSRHQGVAGGARDDDTEDNEDMDTQDESDAGALATLFALRHFGEAEFHALFDLTTWFLDAPTANSRVPVDQTLCPPPRLSVHPGQVGGMTFTINELSTSSPAASSLSVGSTQSRQTWGRQRGGGGGAGAESGSSSPRLPAVSPRNAPTPPSPAAAGGASGSGNAAGHHVPREHRYIPGRHQQHRAVGSLVEALARFEMRREQLLNAKAALPTVTRGSRAGGGSLAQGPVAHSSFSVASNAAGPGGLEDRTALNQSSFRTNGGGAVDPFAELTSTVGGGGAGRSSSGTRTHPSASRITADKPSAADAFASTPPPLDDVGATDPLDPMNNATPDDNSGLNESTTVLASPLIILSTYIRLHGAAWLKNLLDRLFNVLRRESVLLYVNRLDLDASTNGHSYGVGQSGRSSTMCASPVAHASVHTTSASPVAGFAAQNLLDGFEARMERLEDLISQDIQYVMNEFLSALHGRRSATRLPQGITTLITQFCSTVHLHLLRDVLVSSHEGREGRPGSAAHRVAEQVHILKQKRMTAKTVANDTHSNQSLNQLLLSIEQYRLAKFLLFDTWILPALNNAVALGHLPDNAPLHLRWNTDAFARYLKILVNAPFTAAKGRLGQTSASTAASASPLYKSPANPSSPGAATPSATSTRGNSQTRSPRATSTVFPSAGGTTTTTTNGRKKRTTKASMAPPDQMTLPPYITGVYDVSSGCLVRLHNPAAVSSSPTPAGAAKSDAFAGLDASAMALNGSLMQSSRDVSVTLPTMATSRTMIPRGVSHSNSVSLRIGGRSGDKGKGTFAVMDSAPWELLSPTLQSLNEVLGIVGYDPDDDMAAFQAQRATAGMDENCAMRVLDFFCQRISTEATSNVVVSEFEVLPSVATGCIEKLFDFVAGKHPLVEQAMDAKVLPASFSFSPYLSALTGVLLHPMTASQALDNVYNNNPRFYDTLMRPVEDETMLRLVSALVVDQGGAALVDCNALTPLLASQRTEAEAFRGRPRPTSSQSTAGGTSLASKYDEEVRKLVRCKTFLTTGAHARQPVTGLSYADQIGRMASQAGPVNPKTILEAGRARVMEEASFVPTCFDLWWRSMTLAMTVKVITVLAECSSVQSENFLQWCQQKIDGNKREYRLLTDAFVRDKGGETITDADVLKQLESGAAGSPITRKSMSRAKTGSMNAATAKRSRKTAKGSTKKSQKKTNKKKAGAAAATRDAVAA